MIKIRFSYPETEADEAEEVITRMISSVAVTGAVVREKHKGYMSPDGRFIKWYYELDMQPDGGEQIHKWYSELFESASKLKVDTGGKPTDNKDSKQSEQVPRQ